jgi:hypothetical protein
MPTCVLSSGDSWLHTPSHRPATPTNSPVARLAPRFTPTQRSHLSRVPLPPTFNPHRPASAANASGFLLTALSNARRNTHSPAFCPQCASDKALTSSAHYPLIRHWCEECLNAFAFSRYSTIVPDQAVSLSVGASTPVWTFGTGSQLSGLYLPTGRSR